MGKYELIVRKKVSAFVEKQFRYFNYFFDHDEYKKVTYGEKEFRNPLEEKLKNYYDAYMYLLTNAKNPLSKSILLLCTVASSTLMLLRLSLALLGVSLPKIRKRCTKRILCRTKSEVAKT